MGPVDWVPFLRLAVSSFTCADGSYGFINVSVDDRYAGRMKANPYQAPMLTDSKVVPVWVSIDPGGATFAYACSALFGFVCVIVYVEEAFLLQELVDPIAIAFLSGFAVVFFLVSLIRFNSWQVGLSARRRYFCRVFSGFVLGSSLITAGEFMLRLFPNWFRSYPGPLLGLMRMAIMLFVASLIALTVENAARRIFRSEVSVGE